MTFNSFQVLYTVFFSWCIERDIDQIQYHFNVFNTDVNLAAE